MVLRVMKLAPQVQVTSVATYSGWMSACMCVSLLERDRRTQDDRTTVGGGTMSMPCANRCRDDPGKRGGVLFRVEGRTYPIYQFARPTTVSRPVLIPHP